MSTFARFIDKYATLDQMLHWAAQETSRAPDTVLDGGYMYRWHLIPRNPFGNVMLNLTTRSDARCLHDHPWDNQSYVLNGSYEEVMPVGDDCMKLTSVVRNPGDHIIRKAADRHYLQLVDGPVLSLFFGGPKVREWGFWPEGEFVHWKQYTGADGQG